MKKYCQRIEENVDIQTDANGIPVCANHGINPNCIKAKCKYTNASSISSLMFGHYDNDHKDFTTSAKTNANESTSVGKVHTAEAQKAMFSSIFGVGSKSSTQSRSNQADQNVIRVECITCGAKILETTAKKYDGKCAQCGQSTKGAV